MRAIGVIAGAFDPIHLGHVDFIEQSIKEHSLDKVLILIEHESCHKELFSNLAHRKKMVKLAIALNPKIFLYDTSHEYFPISSELPKIKRSHPYAKVHLLIGNDVAKHIWSWDNAVELLKDVVIIVADRSKDARFNRTTSGQIRSQIASKQATDDLNNGVLEYIKSNSLYEKSS